MKYDNVVLSAKLDLTEKEVFVNTTNKLMYDENFYWTKKMSTKLL